MKPTLEGYRIIDFSKLLPGPLATLWMAQQGAEVIKVESPTSPDPVRFYPPIVDGVSAYYSALNKGKKSLSIDYRADDGREQILKLIETTDVVVEQFRPNVMDAFGLGYASLRERNPSIIMVSITGYGQKGEMSGFPGHDINYLSYSGVLDSQRDEDGNPVISAAQLADVVGGSMQALNATVTALLHRERSGEGQHIDVSMTYSVSVLNSLRAAEELATGESGGYLSGAIAPYNVYKCADGKYVSLGALEPKFWQKFCNLMAYPEWGGRMLEKELIAEVADIFVTQPRNYWTDKLEAEGVCFSPVLTVKEASEHPLFTQGIPHPFGSDNLSPAPELGADNDEFLI